MGTHNPLQRSVVIIGAGTQGRRLAYMWSSRGGPVHVVDLDEPQLQEGRLYVQRLRAETVGHDGNWGDITTSSPNLLKSILQDAWLMIECVPESLALKQKVIAQLDEYAPEDTIIASNSSSYGIPEILDGLNLHNNKRALSTHCYWPPETSGYIYNRIWAAIKRETLLALAEGVGTPQEIDAIFKDVLKTGKGPCELMDVVGLDVVLDIEKHYADSRIGLPPQPRDYLQNMIQNGHLGIKSGRGFYNYTGTKDQKQVL